MSNIHNEYEVADLPTRENIEATIQTIEECVATAPVFATVTYFSVMGFGVVSIEVVEVLSSAVFGKIVTGHIVEDGRAVIYPLRHIVQIEIED